ncbi:Undecaprenyl-phosphate glucose phosphotransferase [Pirellula staleyi DSM 6068]|uniref:Undecaprenyl-phosphate glucose phosphotransferase n=1 Tax=Pirellula staleyi (strain ATCC 27377 / DSM 6068 / ICPB 4128) TaxID=530564 RepID=D2R0C9_PIRSD|nr:undecaprenyl-phosphate glucose phosphotransferase [Pirellula staleyi]ADB14797.1 Undecaprenyl-phosphate glucose phosphotransferase [Pirellula staleyi DSM 6068]
MTINNRQIHQQFSVLGTVYRTVDAAAIAVGLGLSLEVSGAWHVDYLLAGCAAIVVHYLAAEFSGMYRSWRGASASREAFATLGVWALSLAMLMAMGFVTERLAHYPRPMLGYWLLMTGGMMVFSHATIRAVRRALWCRGVHTHNAAIVGVTELGFQLGRNLLEEPELGIRFAGFYDDRPAERNAKIPPGLKRQIGGIDDLIADAKAGFVDRIYITFPMRAEDRIRGVLSRLGDTTASVYIVPDFFVFQLLHSRWTDIGGLPAVSVFENPLYGVDGVVKRMFDLVVSSLLLVMLALPMTIVAAMVKFTSRGPVFFRQRRYGLDGEEILVWKFRSMTVCEDGPNVTQATKQDSRVTWLGAIMRRTSIDELPQLFNVVGGTMSLVGPRPHAAAHNEQYRKMIEGYMLRHKVKPGITGLAQVRGWRGETDTLEKMEKRIECDHEYIREWSLWLDIQILFRTFFVVFSRKNAY